MKVLVAIANYGSKNQAYLERLIDEYKSMNYGIDIVVLSNIPKELGSDIEVRCGRQGPHVGGLCRRKLFQKHRTFWFLIRVGIIIKASFGCIRGMVCSSTLRGIEMKITSLIGIGYNMESIKLAWENPKVIQSVINNEKSIS